MSGNVKELLDRLEDIQLKLNLIAVSTDHMSSCGCGGTIKDAMDKYLDEALCVLEMSEIGDYREAWEAIRSLAERG